MRPTNNTEYLTAAQVRVRFGGISRMWLYRRISKDGFPAPVTFGGRYRHFKLTDIEDWEGKMIARAIHENGPRVHKQQPRHHNSPEEKTSELGSRLIGPAARMLLNGED